MLPCLRGKGNKHMERPKRKKVKGLMKDQQVTAVGEKQKKKTKT